MKKISFGVVCLFVLFACGGGGGGGGSIIPQIVPDAEAGPPAGATVKAGYGEGTTGTLLTVSSGKTFILTDIVADTDAYIKQSVNGQYKFWATLTGSARGKSASINLSSYEDSSIPLKDNHIHFNVGIPFEAGESITFDGFYGKYQNLVYTTDVQITITGYEI